MQEIRSLAEEYLGTVIPELIWDDVKEQATRKLERIIEREGDAGGERKKPYYLAQLIAEAVRQEVLTAVCMLDFEEKKKRPCKNTGHLQSNLIIA